MSENYPDYVSQELEFTKVNVNDYLYPTESFELVKCTLDCRYWLNTKTSKRCCVLLLTTFDDRKIKLSVFKNSVTGFYSPSKQVKENFCVRNDLSLNDKLYVTVGKSGKSNNVYLHEIKVA